MQRHLLIIATIGAGVVAGCQSSNTPPTSQPSPIADTQSAVNDAQLVLDAVEAGVTLDEALGGIKQPSTIAQIAADEQAAQNLINAANASLASGSFNLTVFESSFAAAILTYQHDITAAKVATVPTATPTTN